MLARAVLSVSLLCLGCIWCFVPSFLVVSTSAVNCLERLVSEMIYYLSIGTLNLTHSVTHSLWCGAVMVNTLDQETAFHSAAGCYCSYSGFWQIVYTHIICLCQQAV